MPKLSLQTCLYFLSSTLALAAITESSLAGGTRGAEDEGKHDLSSLITSRK